MGTLLALGFLLAAGPSGASTFLGFIQGNPSKAEDLILFDAINDASGISLIGLFDDSEDTGNIVFPEGDPIASGAKTGSIVFLGPGTAVYYTIKAGKWTGLYSYMPMGPNTFDTNDFGGKAFSAARFWGTPGTPIPEPSAATLFALGTLVVVSRLRPRR